MKMLTEPIVMLAPDQEMRAFWDSHVERHGVVRPTSHQVHLTYKDSSGATYEETSVIDLDAMQGSMHTEVKTLHDVGKSLDEIKKVLKGAALLSRNGSVDVQAVTESYEAHKHRLAMEGHTRLRANLESLQGWREKRPEIISDLEDRIARLEANHPFLIEGTGDASLTPRWSTKWRRLATRLRALASRQRQ